MAKRLMYFLCRSGEEAWQHDSDLSELKEEIRSELRQQVPIVTLPPGVWVNTVDLSEAGKADEPDKARED